MRGSGWINLAQEEAAVTTIAILGPEHSQSWQAAAQFAPAAAIRAYPHVRDLLAAFDAHLADYAILPV